ncbi:colipase-like protein 1 [Myotis daubentonii]|uniref:colipase-like protein 1 n=1 Tax=Myotis daubentonii TaxID=98922 RepID=UPI002873CA97|nr:colipase-like protein 1 [Myotis daubentonii]
MTTTRRARGVLFQQNNGEACIQSIKCKSRCCRRDPYNCESHCIDKGSEDDWCHTQVAGLGWKWGLPLRPEGRAAARVKVKSCLSQTFLGLYNECPCLPDLTCIFPKNVKIFKVTYGRCKKIVVKKKLTKRGFF